MRRSETVFQGGILRIAPWRAWRLGGSIPVLGLALLATLLTGCGEYKQSVAYEDGGYQGKKDERMWDNERFMHDPSVWKQMINERTQQQNEYGRTGEQG